MTFYFQIGLVTLIGLSAKNAIVVSLPTNGMRGHLLEGTIEASSGSARSS